MRRSVLSAAAILAVLPLSADLALGTTASAHDLRPLSGVNGSTSSALTTTYTVQSGDYLLGIASKLGVRVDDILRLNGLTLTSAVHPGKVLKVPLRLVSYTVKANDTVSGIASRHGMTAADLLAANGLRTSSVLHPGMVLKVASRPGVQPTPTPPPAQATPAPTTTVRAAAPRVPATTAPAQLVATARTSTYTVGRGDFLIGIANRLGVRLVDLLAVNGFTLSTPIHPGMAIQVPAGAKLPSTPPPATPTPTTAAPATTAGPRSTPPSASETYTVVAGDFLIGIARKLGVRFSDLLAVNQLGSSSVVHPGTVLVVPRTKIATPTTPTTPPAPSTTVPPANSSGQPVAYTVRPGDSVLGISYRLGLKYGPILKLNGITLETPLTVGATLLLPPGTVVPAAPPTTTTPAPTTTAPAPTTTAPAPAATPIDTVLAFTRAQLGKPYKFFTAGPDTYDCSGLTLAAYRQIGVRLPHHSLSQSKLGTSIDWTTEAIQPGDLVFTESSRAPGVIGHVGIAISSTRWIHAPSANSVVREGPLPPSSMIVVVRRYVND